MRNQFQKSVLFFVLAFMSLYAAFAQAKPNNLTLGTYKTIFDMLRDVPGLEVKANNSKSGGTVIVRGVGSLNNQKPPLYVVDGVIYNGDITNINTQDVESINVLKDAATTSIYGSQGAGGVIVINSKKGNNSASNPKVESHTESAYSYFIEHKTKLNVIGLDEKTIVKGVIHSQRDTVLVFMNKKKEILVPIKNILRVEMIIE